jgi:catechol 2,3-dioxygenase-like lactoylglutathione lyase family enzyme
VTDTLQAQLAYAKIPAQDIERARRFYEEKLGLRPFGENDAHLYYEVGGTRFLLFQSAGQASGTHDQLGFVVEDIRTRVGDLKERGVTFEEYDNTVDSVAEFGPIRAAWFKDSEGNLLNLIEGFTAMSA